MSNKNVNIRLLIMSLAILIVIVMTLALSIKGNAMYYTSADEVFNKTGKLRVNGVITLNTTVRQVHGLNFVMSGDINSFNVSYTGIVPEAYKEGQEAVIEGFMDKNTNTFIAKKLLVKCPSKYEAA